MKILESYGEPAIDIGGLRIWIHRREFPDAADYWEANWVNATASCTDKSASVTAEGPILHLGEIDHWLGQLTELHKTLSGEAKLECTEPNLGVVLTCDKLGHMTMEVEITPDQLTQKHAFTIRFDQTHLGKIITACRKILEEFPIKFPLEHFK